MKDYTMRFVFDRKNETGYKGKKKGVIYKEIGLLQIEVKKDNSDKRVWISANVKIRPDQYSDKNGFTCKNSENSKDITGKAHSRYREVEAFVKSDKCKDINYVKFWNTQDKAEFTVIDFIKSELVRRNPSLTVIEYNNSFIRRLNEYGNIVNFEDITYENIIGLDGHLRKTISSEPTLYKRHSLFKGYIQEAINRGIFKGPNPYLLFNSKKGKSKDPVYLTQEEVQLLKDYMPNFGYLERTRDLFLFQCFTGLAYIDLMNFNSESVSETDGFKIIRSNRLKTDENFITLFLPEAERIAVKYKYELPQLTNQKYNEYLKEIAKGAGINKQLVSHSARHYKTYFPLITSNLRNNFN